MQTRQVGAWEARVPEARVQIQDVKEKRLLDRERGRVRYPTLWGFIADFALVAGAFGLLGFTVWAAIHGPILLAVPNWGQLLLMTLTCSLLVGVGINNIVNRR